MSAHRKQFKRGLVVGKFCPLHRGHELLIGRALAACDDVIVISYTKPEFDGCPPATRATWLQALFPAARLLVIDDAALRGLCVQQRLPLREIPHNDATDAVHREFVGWLCWEVLGVAVEAVFTSEDYGDGFADVLSAHFSERMQSASRVAHVCVDKARHAIPVSGTAVRADPHGHRAFLSPQVYASFVKRVCFLGGESSGKTTLAEALADRLSTAWVPEYGRELWERKNGKLEFADMLVIGREQLARENMYLARAQHWLLCDTSPLTTLFYSMAMFGQAETELKALADRPYDLTFLCAPDFPFCQDGTRQDDQFRQRQHAWYLEELAKRKIPFHVLYGPAPRRVNEVLRHLAVP